MGDFNVTPKSLRYQHLVADGWLDAYFDAGNPECDPSTGVGCTSGRDDKSLTTLQDPTNGETERIDFVFVKPAPGCRPAFDPADDANGNGLGTGAVRGRARGGRPGRPGLALGPHRRQHGPELQGEDRHQEQRQEREAGHA